MQELERYVYLFIICIFLLCVSSSKSIWFLSSRYIGTTVKSNSCISAHACQGSDNAVIGPRSCLGDEACKDNTADISDESCQGKESCTMNKANIGKNSCQAKSKACFHNEGSIGDNSVSRACTSCVTSLFLMCICLM